MAGPQHRTPEYRAAYKKFKSERAGGKWFTCVQPICMYPSRAIAPDESAHVAHDDTGTIILGLAHEWCNEADGGRRRSRGPVAAVASRWML